MAKKKEERVLTPEEQAMETHKKVIALSKVYKSISEPNFTRSGSIVIDAILGGGIPDGMFILWSSESGCGKSTGSLHISRMYCMQGKKVLYLDFEGGVNKSQLEGMGLEEYLYDEAKNPDGLFYCYQVQTYKDAEAWLDTLMRGVDLVVIDSATAMLAEKMRTTSSEDVLPGLDSRIVSTFLKKYKAEARRYGTSWILINQIRTKLNFKGITTDTEAGGQALKFYSDVRLLMKRAFQSSLVRMEDTASGRQEVPFGALCTIWAEKNRYARPKIPMSLAVIFGRGLANEYAYFDFLMTKGAIKKKGSWFDVKLGAEKETMQGMPSVITWIGAHKKEVKAYIAAQGGYKLIATSSESLDIGEDNDYDGDFIAEAGEFDQTVNPEDEDDEDEEAGEESGDKFDDEIEAPGGVSLE